MEPKLDRRAWQFNSQTLLLLMVTVAVALGWWRTSVRLEQAQSRIDAMRRAQEIEAAEPKSSENALPRPLPENRMGSAEQFIQSLREVDDWYEFADEIADPFVKTSVADDALPMLLELLDDPDAEVRWRALATLGKMNRHPEIIVPAVIPMLRDPHGNVRWHAAYTLGQFGELAVAARGPLRAQMQDDQSPIAASAATMLRKIDPTEPVARRLVELLANPLDQNRERAIAALVELQTPAAREALVRRYRQEKVPALRDQLARAIARLESLRPSESTEANSE